MAASIDSLKFDSLKVKEEITVTDVGLLMSDEELTSRNSAAEGDNEECEEEDDKLQGWISCESRSSNNYNTKRQIKYSLSLFEEFSKRENVNFEDIDNKALDVLLSNFYKAARNKKGDLYSLKSMQSIRFGLQRYFLESRGINITKTNEFSLSYKTFGAVIRKLRRPGKDEVRRHPQITVDDMARMQASLDLSTPQGLQHKVFLDIVLYFGIKIPTLRTTRPGDFVLHQEKNQLFYTFLENQKAQMHAMPGNPRCPVANLKRYISKLNSNCGWMWQRPTQRFLEDHCIWYENSPLGKRTLSLMTRTISDLAGCNKGHNHHSLRTMRTEKMLEALSSNDSTSQNRDYAITVITLPRSTSNSVFAQINKTITAGPRVPVAAPITDSSMNIIKSPSVTASSSDKATHLQTMQQNTSVTSKSNTGVNEGTMTELTWIELPRKLVQSKDASTQWEKQPPTHSTQAASTSSTQDLDKPSCGDDGELEQDGLGWCSEDTPAVQEDEFMDSSEPSDVHIDGSIIVAGSRGHVEETTVVESQEGKQSKTPILRRMIDELIDEEVDYQTVYVKEEYFEDECQDDDYAHVHLTPGGHPRLDAESPRSTQQTNSDRAPRQNGGPCIGSKEAIMAEATLPRFELRHDDQLQDLIGSESSKNTKKSVKFSVKIFEDYLQIINTDLNSVNKLPNLELDKVLQRFYAGARQKNGSLYTKKSMQSIRYGLQRFFLISKNVDIGKHEDFTNSKSVFKQFFLLKGQGVVNHKPAISQEDMDKIQGSLDLDDPQGLQDKVFIDVMLYFCILGRENIRDMTLDSFEICEEALGGKCYITLKDTLTRNSRADKLGGVMTPTNGPRCPVASFLRYKDKLNPKCKWFWQRPAQHKREFNPSCSGPWYRNVPLGINSIGEKMKTISSSAGTKAYTNHCLRATSISTLQNARF
ncbi:uncharacterized protein LOC764748 isoform X2 [Strongylocentrotus purpuratus]|uniref:DUF3504 domain-containing protein n=1 Tax=Strongylocentrotus purpuratus TaxID=7668 RepID=A0A7M7NKR5_STRPU|nr:uncharacterized protein LOC764748 isoform X2 [Strongylocentrotus purpuratus]